MEDPPIIPDDLAARIADHLQAAHAGSTCCPFCLDTEWTLGLAGAVGYIARTCQNCASTFLLDPAPLNMQVVWYAPPDGHVSMWILLDTFQPPS